MKNIECPVNLKSDSIERIEIPEIPLEAIREARNSKQRYVRMERKKISECILNAKNSYGIEYGGLFVGDLDIDIKSSNKNFYNRIFFIKEVK